MYSIKTQSTASAASLTLNDAGFSSLTDFNKIVAESLTSSFVDFLNKKFSLFLNGKKNSSKL